MSEFKTETENQDRQEPEQTKNGTLGISGFLGIAGGILLAAGVWLPWLKAFVLTSSGYDRLGSETLMLVVAGTVSAIMGLAGMVKKHNYSLLFAIFGFGGLVYLGFAMFRLRDQMSTLGISNWVATGSGFWICVVGSVLLIIAWLAGKGEKK